MKKLITLVFILISCKCFGQQITFQKINGGTLNEFGYAVAQTTGYDVQTFDGATQPPGISKNLDSKDGTSKAVNLLLRMTRSSLLSCMKYVTGKRGKPLLKE